MENVVDAAIVPQIFVEQLQYNLSQSITTLLKIPFTAMG